MNPDQPSQPLQFDKAEFAQGAALKCAFCQSPITGQYFQINGQVACPNCRDQVSAHAGRAPSPTEPLLALGAGAGAAFVGWVIYWAIAEFLHIELGLVSILVGWMVGVAVRWGSGGRGGLFYQVMALALTYVSIAFTYLPGAIRVVGPDGSLVSAIVLALRAPFLGGASNILGLLIMAFGLYQAWITNRKANIEVSGPYTVAR